uniref:Uncharacterized protein n=1 Tax=Rhizophora mucronata TaxID=61149 RepID=A0A2P2QQT0_RHIMU
MKSFPNKMLTSHLSPQKFAFFVWFQLVNFFVSSNFLTTG